MDFSDAQIERYSRHLILKEIGGVGQERLKSSSVLVVGAGGLGSAFLLYLVASGIGKIGIVEFDRVELSNLSRQILYRTSDIKQEKIKVVEKELKDLNPEVELELFGTKFNRENFSNIVSSYHLIVDCTDNFESRFMINELAIKNNKPLISGAVVRFEGNIMLIIPHKTFCYSCLFEEPQNDNLQFNCNNAGVLGSVVGTIATIMCTETIKYLIDTEHCAGHLLVYNGITQSLRKIKINRDKNCSICSKS